MKSRMGSNPRCPHCHADVQQYQSMLPVKTECGKCRMHIRLVAGRYRTWQEWLGIKSRIVIGVCGGAMQACAGNLAEEVLLECSQCGATRLVSGREYALGRHDNARCEVIHGRQAAGASTNLGEGMDRVTQATGDQETTADVSRQDRSEAANSRTDIETAVLGSGSD